MFYYYFFYCRWDLNQCFLFNKKKLYKFLFIYLFINFLEKTQHYNWANKHPLNSLFLLFIFFNGIFTIIFIRKFKKKKILRNKNGGLYGYITPLDNEPVSGSAWWDPAQYCVRKPTLTKDAHQRIPAGSGNWT